MRAALYARVPTESQQARTTIGSSSSCCARGSTSRATS